MKPANASRRSSGLGYASTIETPRATRSVKALKAKPEEPASPEEPPVKAYERKNKGLLKGGIGGTGPGGLFGNPSDFGR